MSTEPVVLTGDPIREGSEFQRPCPLECDAGEAERGRVIVNAKMRKLDELLRKVAWTPAPVLILGETGTGKEVAARAIHRHSHRSGRPFFKVNCAALPRDLLESELFGYEAGAFTGATRPKPGHFELCNRGTLLLDEIAEMPAELQAKLLHVIQDGSFCRLGGRSQVRVDVRVLAATNVDIRQAIATNQFRQDLYYRLAAFTIRIPPLRERRDEIPALLEHFIRVFSAKHGCTPAPITPDLLDRCMKHSWPGNLRELENVVKRYLVLGDAEGVLQQLTADLKGAEVHRPTLAQVAAAGLRPLMEQLKQSVESVVIAEALKATNYNHRGAARLLKISYKALLYKVRNYELTLPSAVPSEAPQ